VKSHEMTEVVTRASWYLSTVFRQGGCSGRQGRGRGYILGSMGASIAYPALAHTTHGKAGKVLEESITEQQYQHV